MRFRIPADWVEEYGELGGGTFYRSGDDTGTLRLEVMTFKAPAGQALTNPSLGELLQAEAAKYGGVVRMRRDGEAISKYDMPSMERGQELRIRFWRIAQAVPPKHLRMVLFSYTLLAEKWGLPESSSEMELLDREIAASELAPMLGETPPVKKSWWHFW